jgi:hypothetical protein
VARRSQFFVLDHFGPFCDLFLFLGSWRSKILSTLVCYSRPVLFFLMMIFSFVGT